MKVYAKQSKDGKVIALMEYGYTPPISPDSGVEIITKEEYDALMKSTKPFAPNNTNEISDREAIAIITGEVSADDA